uniref:Transposase Helix-turn-helix domain-containing protein n=1 Tax=Amphimedon queenslandica TaxID=400682 RepID=A0A1X7VFX8_AMPQE
MKKLCLNLFEEDLAFRFSVHVSTISRLFHEMLDIFYVTRHLIKWPQREKLQSTMPATYRKFFSKFRVIIDCSKGKT